MLKTKHLISSILTAAALSLVFLASCGGDDTPPTAEEQRLIDLAGGSGVTWTLTSATFEGSPTSDFDGMTVTLRTDAGAGTYSSTNGSPVFSSSGTWALGTSISQLIFDGNQDNVFNVTNLDVESNPKTVTLTVNFTEPGGTIEGINGTYVFNFEHN